MKLFKLGIGVLSAAMMLSTATPAFAASASVYVVNHYQGTGSFFPNQKFSYNKNGLMSKSTQTGSVDDYYNGKYTETYTYKKNKITKTVSKNAYGLRTVTPIYKGGKLKTLKWTGKGFDNSKGTVKYTYSGNVISKAYTSYTDSQVKQSYSTEYTYENGLLIKEGETSYNYDSKGYLSYRNPVYIGDTSDAITLRNTYNSKGLLKATYIKSFENNNVTPSKKPILKVTYKKIKVSKSMVKKIKAQQKWILRNIRDDSIYNI